MSPTSPSAELHDVQDLYDLFSQPAPAAQRIAAASVPEPYRSLLAHERHMTVTLDRHWGAPVEVTVVERAHREPFYARKILLINPETRAVVQFGIMQFDFRCASAEVREQILSERIPLGRILIAHGVLRRIARPALLEIEPDHELRSCLSLSAAWPGKVYGRLATIFCNDQPAVDLLEILPPLSPGDRA